MNEPAELVSIGNPSVPIESVRSPSSVSLAVAPASE